MKIPLRPPPIGGLLTRLTEPANANRLVTLMAKGIGPAPGGKYRHWDTLRHLTPPDGITPEEWWIAIKLARNQMLKPLPLKSLNGLPFQYAMPDPVLRMMHETDRDASGHIEISEQVTNPSTRDRYIIDSLMEEAITSSQLEGASTTKERAKEMIRSGRRPVDRSERMILNNYRAMRYVSRFTKEPLTPERIFELHKLVTRDTLDDPSSAGRFRTPAKDIRVVDERGTVLHIPPPASELSARMAAMCEFANSTQSEQFIHPVIRSIILHFWFAYDHPFVDGNGRTARALFYWSMLSRGYWLCEYLSISTILRAAPAKYSRSFLYCETDDNDLTYFIVYQLAVLRRSIEQLHAYIERKIDEVRQVDRLLRRSGELNHRQLALLSHALKHPDFAYSIASHRYSHNVVYQTARTDLLGLARKRLLMQRKLGRTLYFYPAPDLVGRLRGHRGPVSRSTSSAG